MGNLIKLINIKMKLKFFVLFLSGIDHIKTDA